MTLLFLLRILLYFLGNILTTGFLHIVEYFYSLTVITSLICTMRKCVALHVCWWCSLTCVRWNPRHHKHMISYVSPFIFHSSCMAAIHLVIKYKLSYLWQRETGKCLAPERAKQRLSLVKKGYCNVVLHWTWQQSSSAVCLSNC